MAKAGTNVNTVWVDPAEADNMARGKGLRSE